MHNACTTHIQKQCTRKNVEKLELKKKSAKHHPQYLQTPNELDEILEITDCSELTKTDSYQ